MKSKGEFPEDAGGEADEVAFRAAFARGACDNAGRPLARYSDKAS